MQSGLQRPNVGVHNRSGQGIPDRLVATRTREVVNGWRRAWHFLRGVFVVMALGFSLRSELVKPLLKLILETVSLT